MAATDLLTLSEARDSLRLSASDTSRDSTLAGVYIPAVTALVEDIVGPVVKRTLTLTVNGGERSVLLEPTRLVSVTSVVEGGVTLAPTAYVADVSAGILYRGTSTATGRFASGIGAVVVTYVAGMVDETAAVPAPIKLAARIILSHLWQSDQQGYRPEFGTPGDDSTVEIPAGFAVPRQAYALLEPWSTSAIPGFA